MTDNDLSLDDINTITEILLAHTAPYPAARWSIVRCSGDEDCLIVTIYIEEVDYNVSLQCSIDEEDHRSWSEI